ncbi:TerC/Alx family metal homeostasis membrane protein [Nesterenkonia populi]
MDIPVWVWLLTFAAVAALLLFDFFAHVRHDHEPSLREAALWSGGYIGLGVAFGAVLLPFLGPEATVTYYAGYITEKALSVDNLFVFLVIISSFGVPRRLQQRVLLFGIALAMVVRTVFILLGAGLIEAFSGAFYVFGALLVLTAANMLRRELAGAPRGGDQGESGVVRVLRRLVPMVEHYDDHRLTTWANGRRVATPMLLVMLAIGGTDLLFALDSIPAIYGLTQEPFIVFAATAFSLMGLRQLYFLIDGLVRRLVFLSYGLTVILGFIGAKLILHALGENSLPFINAGQPVPVPQVSTTTSLLVILSVLAVTVVASLMLTRRRGQRRTGAPEGAGSLAEITKE